MDKRALQPLDKCLKPSKRICNGLNTTIAIALLTALLSACDDRSTKSKPICTSICRKTRSGNASGRSNLRLTKHRFVSSVEECHHCFTTGGSKTALNDRCLPDAD